LELLPLKLYGGSSIDNPILAKKDMKNRIREERQRVK
jgi:hypothetical protein